MILYSLSKLKYKLGFTIAPIAAPLLASKAFIIPVKLSTSTVESILLLNSSIVEPSPDSFSNKVSNICKSAAW